MRVVIIEDEAPAAEMLRQLLAETASGMEVAATLTSVRDAVEWFRENSNADLIFMDIELGDGLSLEIFDKVKLGCPVIFITAYDEYWQEAFEHNGIDYLLKPLRKERLELALQKFRELNEYFNTRFQNLIAWQTGLTKRKERFLIKKGIKYITVKATDIAYFFSAHKLTFLVDKGGGRHSLDDSLIQIESQVDPDKFFRINRKYLIHIDSIIKIQTLPKSKLVIEVKPPVSETLVISSENSAGFKRWINR